MEYITLGKTGLRVSRLGFGGLPIQRVDEAEAGEIIRAAIDSGINYIDTARGYTVSEGFIGKALSGGLRSKVILATKSMSRDKQSMARDIDISLGNLCTDYIDIYQCHNVPATELEKISGEGGALEALIEAREAGKIGHIGLTTHSIETFKMALNLPWVECIMFPYNVVETQAVDCVAECARRNIGFLAMKPLAGGAIEDGDIALRYLLSDENVTIVLPGVSKIEEIGKNAASEAAERGLSETDLDKIADVRKKLGENFCRRCNYCAPCAKGIQIPSVFLFQGYLERYGLEGWARARYATLSAKAGDCIKCGLCESRCPYHLPIREMMEKAAKAFGE